MDLLSNENSRCATGATENAAYNATEANNNKPSNSAEVLRFENGGARCEDEWASVNLTQYNGKSYVYDYVFQINLKEGVKDSRLYNESPALRKAEDEDQWCCMLCKEEGKELLRCFAKLPQNKTTNPSTHLKSMHGERLSKLKPELDKRKNKVRNNEQKPKLKKMKLHHGIAVARSVVTFPPEVMSTFQLSGSTIEMVGTRGSIFGTAKTAGIMGAKKTCDLIPLCYPLALDRVNIDINLVNNQAIIECECHEKHKRGVETEALTGASIAALTIYDMVKDVSHRVEIGQTVLVSKSAGE